MVEGGSEQAPGTDSQLIRFDFEGHPVRGAALRITNTWQDWAARRAEPAHITALLGQATAALPLMAAHLKFKGRMNLQLQRGAGLGLLLAQIDHTLKLRSTLQLNDGFAGSDWPTMVEGGQLGVLLDPENAAEQYQALVPVGGPSLAHDLAGYFEQSEQLPTRLWLAADAHACAGVLLQRLPSEQGDPVGFDTLAAMGDTVTDDELLGLDAARLVHRLFATEGMRLHDQRPVALACNCSENRIASLILGLGREEVGLAHAEPGGLEITCDFCGTQYRYTEHQTDALFAASEAVPPSDAAH